MKRTSYQMKRVSIYFVFPGLHQTGPTPSLKPPAGRCPTPPNTNTSNRILICSCAWQRSLADIFIHDLQATRASRPIWQWLVLLAAFLLPVDIASRRLIITNQDLLRLREWILARLNVRRPTAPKVVAPPTPRMQALLKAKDRAAESTKSPTTTPMDVSAPPGQPVSEPQQKTDQPLAEAEGTPQKEPTPPETSTSTTTSLLERNKALRKKRQ